MDRRARGRQRVTVLRRCLMFEILICITAAIQPPAPSLELKLGSPKYSTREKMSQHLEKIWPISRTTLRLMAKTSTDPEVVFRANTILKKCRQKDFDSL